ncbi:MAG TPA: hypothetical protein VFQ85_12070 [Mycobacteriales bacterium]|nr:hypothetical protein [Mycobacteriales bacterium]
MSVLATLEKLDHRLTGRPETDYVFEARRWRLRLALVVLLTLLSLVIALVSDQAVAGWVLVAFAIATGVKTVLARRAWRASAVQVTGGRWYER